MTDDTNNHANGWTIDTLHAFFIRILEEKDQQQVERDNRYQQRFEAQQEALHSALAATEKTLNATLTAAEKASLKTEVALDKRFDSVNEFRKTLTDQAATFFTRAEGDARFDSINGKLMDNTAMHGAFASQQEHNALISEVSRLELDMKTCLADTVRRADITPITNEINKMRDTHATSAGKSMATNSMMSFGLAVFAVLISLGAIWFEHTPYSHPADISLKTPLEQYQAPENQPSSAVHVKP